MSILSSLLLSDYSVELYVVCSGAKFVISPYHFGFSIPKNRPQCVRKPRALCSLHHGKLHDQLQQACLCDNDCHHLHRIGIHHLYPILAADVATMPVRPFSFKPRAPLLIHQHGASSHSGPQRVFQFRSREFSPRARAECRRPRLSDLECGRCESRRS